MYGGGKAEMARDVFDTKQNYNLECITREG